MVKTSLSLAKLFLDQRDHLFHWCAVFLGIGVGCYFLLPRDLVWFEISVLGLCAVVICLLLGKMTVLAQMAAVLMVMVLLGLCSAGVRTNWVAAPVLGWPYYGNVTGVVTKIDRSASDALRLTIKDVVVDRISQPRTPKRVRVALYGEIPEGVLIGKQVSLVAFLMPPQGPAEPEGFDFQRYIWFMGIGAVGYTKKPVIVLGEASSWRHMFWAQRQEQFSTFIRAHLPDQTGGLAAALMAGDRSYLDQTLVEDLRRSNLAHLLAIFGLHMGLLCSVVFTAVRFLLVFLRPSQGVIDGKKLAAIFALAFGATYLLITGASVSTQRSFIMVSVMLAAVLVDRRVMSLRMVSLAAMVILLVRPESLVGPGFQMSFAATLALVVTFKRFNSWFPHKFNWAKGPAALFVSSFVAGLATAPISAAHFNQISQLGLFANLLSVPMMTLLVAPCALLAVVLAPLGLEAIGFVGVDYGLRWIVFVAQYVSSLDYAARLVPMPPWYFVPLFSLGMLIILLWQGWGKAIGLLAVVASFAVWITTERPDILIEARGELVGVMTEEGRSLSKEKGAGFVADIWMENDAQVSTRTEAFANWQSEDILHFWSKKDEGRVISCESQQIIVSKIDVDVRGDFLHYDLRRAPYGSIAIWMDDTGRIERIKTAKTASYQRLWTR